MSIAATKIDMPKRDFGAPNESVLAQMAKQIGLAARSGRLITYDELADGSVIELPGRDPIVLLDLPGSPLKSEARHLLDEYASHLAEIAFSYAQIIPSAILVARGANRPTNEFLNLGRRLRRDDHQADEAFWISEVTRVFAWFKALD